MLVVQQLAVLGGLERLRAAWSGAPCDCQQAVGQRGRLAGVESIPALLALAGFLLDVVD
jgi:hypothetical protein